MPCSLKEWFSFNCFLNNLKNALLFGEHFFMAKGLKSKFAIGSRIYKNIFRILDQNNIQKFQFLSNDKYQIIKQEVYLLARFFIY